LVTTHVILLSVIVIDFSIFIIFFFSSRRRHTRSKRDWSSDVCSSDLTVHRGHDERLDRVVALKIMHPHLAMDEDFRRRFAREARSAARLAHRNVVGVFDQGEDEERIYLAMELVEGETLRARIVAPERLTLRESLDVPTKF